MAEVKLTIKSFGTQTWAKQATVEPEIRFFAISSSLALYFSFKMYRMIFELFLTTSRVKTYKKIWGPRISSFFLCYFLKFASLVLLDIEQDCSLGQ